MQEFRTSLEQRTESLNLILVRLISLPKHVAYFLQKNSAYVIFKHVGNNTHFHILRRFTRHGHYRYVLYRRSFKCESNTGSKKSGFSNRITGHWNSQANGQVFQFLSFFLVLCILYSLFYNFFWQFGFNSLKILKSGRNNITLNHPQTKHLNTNGIYFFTFTSQNIVMFKYYIVYKLVMDWDWGV